MLLRSSSIQSPLLETPQELESVSDDNTFQDYIHYTKFGLVSRKQYFILSFYKTENLEKFKANKDNAAILAPILATLIQFFIPDLKNCILITTPQRAHSEKLGYHFASEVCILTAQIIPLEFIPDVITAANKNKFKPQFEQVKPLPKNKRILLFDDIATTFQTLYATMDVLKQNPENQLKNVNITMFVGINNN